MKILVNLDCLSDSIHRHDLKNNFEEYYEAQAYDDAIVPLSQILRTLGEEYEIIVYSQMPEHYRLQVEDWLIGADIPADEVLLREENDYSKKHECIMQMIECIDNVQCVIENDIRLVELMRDDELYVLESF